MKSFVVLTYYQLAHAVAMTLNLGEKTNLYISVSYLGVGNDAIARIKGTGLFHDVIPMDHRAPNKQLLDELEKTKDLSDEEIDQIGNSIFEKCLNNFYTNLFSGADFEDDLYLYNDFQPHYYYIANHFKSIIGVEDGYGILENQMRLINTTGVESFNQGKYKSRFIGKYWPEMQWKNPTVKTVYSSVPLTPDAPDYLKDKVTLLDYRELVLKHKEEHRAALEYIFDFSVPEIDPHSSIVLTQPLSRNKYCSSMEDYMVHRKMIREEQKKTGLVYIKPHPGDKIDYSVLESENVVLLDKRFPAELLHNGIVSTERVMTFMSAAAEGIKAEEHIKLFDSHDVDRDKIVQRIKDYVKGETMSLSYYVRIRDCSPENYVNAYLIPNDKKRIKTNVYLLFDQKADVEPSYYGAENVGDRVSQYIKNRQKAKDVILWREEIEQLQKNIDTIKESIHFVENADCSEKGIAELVRDDESEFFFVADIHNNGMELRTDVLKLIIDEPVRLVQGFRSHTVVNGIQRSIGTGITNSVMTNTLENRLCHRALLTGKTSHESSFFNSFEPVLLGKDSLISFVRNSFYVDARDCKLLDESIESLCQMLMKSETADHAGCMIREITAWLNAYDRPFSDLEEILDNAGYEYPKGLLQAYIVSTFNRRKENNRVVVKKASEFKYARRTLDQMLIDGTFYKVKQQYSTSSKKSSISSKIKKKMHKK